MIKIKRVQEFRKDGLGIFIHYGLYNHFKRGEWFQDMYKLNSKEYFIKVKESHPLKLDINFKDLVQTVKQNGFKYIVFTVKHHDGFALFDSKGISKYDINLLSEKKRFYKRTNWRM